MNIHNLLASGSQERYVKASTDQHKRLTMSKFENSDMGGPTFNVPSQEANFCDRGRLYPLHIPLALSAWFRILRMSHAPERTEKMMSFHVQNVGSYR